MTSLVDLPSELRQQIYQHYFKVDGGYVFNGDSEKLTAADGSPIDLSLVYTCRSIANDTKYLPLAFNPITFSTVYREDWRALAGCFNYISVFYRLLEADLVVRLARFMTPDMYSQLALMFPTFVSQIQEALMEHEESLNPADFMSDAEFTSDDESTTDDESEASSSADIPEWNIRIGHRMGHAFQWSRGMMDTRWPNDFYDGFGSIPGSRHPLRKDWVGSFWEIQQAMSYCLRILAEKEPAEFTRLIYEALPEWSGTYPAHEFLDLAFEPWAIPSRSEVATATSRLEADNAWELLERWYYTPREAYNISGWDFSAVTEKFTGTRCREKIRFSAAAVAIRFLQRLPVYHRLQIRNVALHEDLPSVGCPSAHVQGLAPFFKENPRLRVERRVSVLGCIEARFGPPQNTAWFLQHPATHGGWRSIDMIDFPDRLSEWLLGALAVTDVGIPAKAFTFVLEGGPHADFCTDLFQQAVHRDIAWYRAYKACIDRDLVYFPPRYRPIVIDEGFDEAMEHLINQTSFIRCDFHPGLPLDFEKLVDETKTLDYLQWEQKRVLREPRLLPFPSTLPYADTLADNYEIQTEDEYLRKEPGELSA